MPSTSIAQRTLGRTGFEVSVLGVGGHTYPVGASSDDFCTPEKRADLIRHLVEAGVNYFDTTWFNEVELLTDSLRRAEIRENLRISLQFVDGISDPNWRQKLRRELEMRLQLLDIDQAPLFIMGVGNNKPPFAGIVAACEAMQRLKDEGLIANLGLSCHELSRFETVADVIEHNDLIDYLMIRYNWKFPQASERLFPIAQAHGVGIVGMKTFCWDCGPENWGRRISIFEPVDGQEPASPASDLNAAQRAWWWQLQTAPCATTVPAINAKWEADELIEAARAFSAPLSARPVPSTSDFSRYADRLYDRGALVQIAGGAESAAIRGRAAELLKSLT